MANCPLCGARIKEPEMEAGLEAMHCGFASGLRGDRRNPYATSRSTLQDRRMSKAWDRGFRIAADAKETKDETCPE